VPVYFRLDPSVFLRTFFSHTFINKNNVVCTADDGLWSELSLERKNIFCYFCGISVIPYSLHGFVINKLNDFH